MKQLRLDNEKRVVVANKQGKKLVGYIYPKKSDTVILMCAGGTPLGDVRNFFHFIQFYHQILPVPVLRFDYIGTGESDKGNPLNIHDRIDDIKVMVDYCYKHWKHVVLYAPSNGTLFAILGMKQGLNVDKILSVNGLFNFNDVGFHVKRQLWVYRLLRPREYASQMKYIQDNYDESSVTVPTMVIYSTRDKWIHTSQQTGFYDRNRKNKILYAIKGADHTGQLTRRITKESDKATQEFLKEVKKFIGR